MTHEKPHRRGRSALERGFTLVELMVAMAAGIAVAGAAYMLSKGSLDAFNQETRISTAQFSATLGMNRLIADISRAGYQMSPNIQADTAKQCGTAATINSVAYARLQAIHFYKDGDADRPSHAIYPVPNSAALPDNAGFPLPDVLRIAGNFATTEQFEFRTIQGKVITLSMNRGSTQRFLREMDLGGPTWGQVFPPNGWVRLVDGTGRELYMQLDNTGGTACTTATCTLTLVNTPDSSELCGPGGSRGLINPISIVDYWIGNVTAPATFTSFKITGAAVADVAPNAKAGGDADRTELIRTEYTIKSDVDDTLIPINSEIVAEYAVGLSFGLTYRNVPPVPPLSSMRVKDPATGLPDPWPGTKPLTQRWASVTAQLSTRARVPDRLEASPNPMGRYAVCPVATGCFAKNDARFARVRTLTREVNLPNLAGVTW